MEGIVKVLVYAVIGLAVAAGLAIFVLTLVLRVKNKEIIELQNNNSALTKEVEQLKARREVEGMDDEDLPAATCERDPGHDQKGPCAQA